MEENKEICTERPACEQPKHSELKFWVIDYSVVKDPSYEGMAVVCAEDVGWAQRTFFSDSAHNGTQGKIIINKIEQIPFPWERGLIMEKYVKTF